MFQQAQCGACDFASAKNHKAFASFTPGSGAIGS
jgi:hypothetical protein